MTRATLLLLLILPVGIGCQTARSADDAESKATALTKTPTWVLEGLTVKGKKHLIKPGERATLSFEANGRVSGDTGCNLLGGTYKAKADGTIAFPETAVTERACEHLAFEGKYLEAFWVVSKYEVGEKTLVLSDGTKANRLEFVPFEPMHLPLAGTEWTLTHFTESNAEVASATGVLGRRPLTLKIDKERASGSAGCNNYFGGVTFPKEGQLKFGPLASTKKACLGDGIMQQESKFLATLSKMTTFTVNETVLTLSNTDGTLGLQFRGPKAEKE